MHYPIEDKTLLSIYQCCICKESFMRQTNPVRVSCAINHLPGSCCHYSEEHISDETIARIYGAIQEQHK